MRTVVACSKYKTQQQAPPITSPNAWKVPSRRASGSAGAEHLGVAGHEVTAKDLAAVLTEHAAEVVDAVEGYDSPNGVEFGIPSSTEGAQELGFPSIGCFEAMGAFVTLALRAEGIGVNFARRGSTPGGQRAIYARYLAEGHLRDEE